MGLKHAEWFDWNASAVKVLKREWMKGTTARVIANMLGAPSASSVMGKADRLGLPQRDATPPSNKFDWSVGDRLAILRAGYSAKDPRPVSDIAAAIGCSRSRVIEKAQDLGLKHPFRFVRNRPGFIGAAQATPPDLAKRQAKAAVPVAPESRNLAMIELDIGCCKFPTSRNDAPHGMHRFCGAKIAVATGIDLRLAGKTHLPYCEFHQKAAVREGYTHGVPDKEAA